MSCIITRHGSVIRPKPAQRTSVPAAEPKVERDWAPASTRDEIANDESYRSQIVFPVIRTPSSSESEDSDDGTEEESNTSDDLLDSNECQDAYLSIGKPIKDVLEFIAVEEENEEESEDELKDFDSEEVDSEEEEEWEKADESEEEEEGEGETKQRTLRTQSERTNRTLHDFTSDHSEELNNGQRAGSSSKIATSGGHQLRIKRNSYHYPPPPATDESGQPVAEAEQPTEPKFRGLHLYQSRKAQLVIEDEGPKSDIGGAERGLVLTRDVESVASLEPYGGGGGSSDSIGIDNSSRGNSGELAVVGGGGVKGEGSGERRLGTNPAGNGHQRFEVGAEMNDAGLRRRMRKIYDNRVVRKSKMHLFPMGKRRLDSNPLELLPSKNWNEEFQKLWERKLGASRDTPESKEGFEDEQLVVRLGIGKLASEFTELALKLGKVIIDEFLDPGTKKTIPPVDVGGVAGGLKYLSHNIFFKFAVDENGIFGGDEWAMKAAAHELKGLSQYMMLSIKKKIAGLHFPLMALVNYRGWRLVASSVLPIDETTIAYGSPNSRRTVHADDPVLNDIMQQAASHLNLKGHEISSRDGTKRVFIHAPGDVEGHLGKDGRYYLLDTHRVMPPTISLLNENKYKQKGNCWYQLFRPEFMRDHAPTALSPDALSAWGLVPSDPQSFEEHNAEVVYAAEVLITKIVRLFSDKLNFRYGPEVQRTFQIRQIILQLHRQGLNVRYLGHVRRYVSNDSLRSLLRCEIIARTLKNLLRERWRKVRGESVSHVTAEFYNEVFVWPRADWWQFTLHLEVRRRAFLMRKSDMELLSPEDRYWVWQRVDDMLGISWNIPYNKILTMYIQRRRPITAQHVNESQRPIIDRLFIVSFYEGHVKFQKWKRKRKLNESMMDISRHTEMSVRVKGPARVAKMLAATASEEILAGRRKRPQTQSTLLGEIFTEVDLPEDVWRGVRWDERVCEKICGKYLETLESLTNDVAALNNWAIALKTLAVIKARKLIQLLRRRQLTAEQVPNLTWLFKPSYDKYCEALEVSDKDDSLWYNMGALCYENALAELELGNKEIAAGHLNNALRKLEHVLVLLKEREGSAIGSVEETMEVFGEVIIGLGVIYAMKASLEPSLNRQATSLLNKAQGLCSQVKQMEQQREERQRWRHIEQTRQHAQEQARAVDDRDELEEWESSDQLSAYLDDHSPSPGSGGGSVAKAGKEKAAQQQRKKEKKREEKRERKREKKEAKEKEKLQEQKAKESGSACLEEMIKDIRKQLKAQDALWAFLRKSGRGAKLAGKLTQPVILDRLASNTKLPRLSAPPATTSTRASVDLSPARLRSSSHGV